MDHLNNVIDAAGAFNKELERLRSAIGQLAVRAQKGEDVVRDFRLLSHDAIHAAVEASRMASSAQLNHDAMQTQSQKRQDAP